MTQGPGQRKGREVSLLQLLPNMMTIAAICAGLTAIRVGIAGDYRFAVLLILLAFVLDGLDGRVARALSAHSPMGAELDSLADFLNFGVAPPLLLFFWGLQDLRSLGWICVLIFAVCAVLRLARFNVSSKSDDVVAPRAFFVGVPAPAGAMLVLLPMITTFAFETAPRLPSAVLAPYIIAVGMLMISRVPTWSAKTSKVSRSNVKGLLVVLATVGGGLLTFPWITLVILCLTYVATVIWTLGFLWWRRLKKGK